MNKNDVIILRSEFDCYSCDEPTIYFNIFYTRKKVDEYIKNNDIEIKKYNKGAVFSAVRSVRYMEYTLDEFFKLNLEDVCNRITLNDLFELYELKKQPNYPHIDVNKVKQLDNLKNE